MKINLQGRQIQQILTTIFFFKNLEYVAYFLGLQFATNSLSLQLSIQLQ